MYYVHDLVWSPNNQPLWIAVQAIGAIFAAIGTVAAFFVILAQVRKAQAQIKVMHEQTEALRATTGWDLLLRMADRFDSERICAARGRAALTLKSAMTDERPADFWTKAGRGRRVQDVIDVFEDLGLLVKQRALDEKAVWSTFSYYITNYYSLCTQTRWFEEWCGDDPTFYEEFKWLYARMQELRHEEPEADFLEEEMMLIPEQEQGGAG